MIYLIWIFTIGLTIFFFKYRQNKRIRELSALIDNLYANNYKIPMKQDSFSILEDRIYKLFVELVEEKEQVRDLSYRQNKNMEDIAHQIKTPITGILFSIENGIDDEKIEILKEKLNRLDRLSDSLLKLASLDVKIDDMKKENIKAKEIIEYSMDILEEDINKKDILLENKLGDEEIVGDFYYLTEAFINIIKNAINLDNISKIFLESGENPIYTWIKILDDGGGISDKDKDKIFERFYKTPDSKGFGIGLSMARDIILKHKGDIEVKNVDKGAEFTIKFYKVT